MIQILLYLILFLLCWPVALLVGAVWLFVIMLRVAIWIAVASVALLVGLFQGAQQ